MVSNENNQNTARPLHKEACEVLYILWKSIQKIENQTKLVLLWIIPRLNFAVSDSKILDKESVLGLSPFKIFTRGCHWPVATPVPVSKSIHPTIHSKFLESIKKRTFLHWHFFLNLKFQECIFFSPCTIKRLSISNTFDVIFVKVQSLVLFFPCTKKTKDKLLHASFNFWKSPKT